MTAWHEIPENKEKVNAFHRENPEVWQLFKRFTFEKIRQGFKHYSAMSIFERIRWETPAGDDGKEQFKLNTNYRKAYALRFMKLYPEYEGFFRMRDHG